MFSVYILYVRVCAKPAAGVIVVYQLWHLERRGGRDRRTKEQKNKRIKEQKEKGKRTPGKMFVNFFLMFGSWRSLIRIQLEFKYLCWRNKEGVSKLTFACYLFLFRHGLHGKHRFSLFFFPWNPRNPCLKEIIKCILTHSLFYLWKRQCVLYRMLTIKEQKNGKGRCFG